MNEAPFQWPEDESEGAALARSLLINESVSNARYWINWGSHLLKHPQPDKPPVRSWSAMAKEDRAFREVFATLNDQQRSKVIELLQRCISGAVFRSLSTLDEFPHGEAELSICDGVCGSGTRRFKIAPTDRDLHDDFGEAFDCSARTPNEPVG